MPTRRSETQKTFLVIDDEPHIRRVIRHALLDVGTRVLEAATARDGIDATATTRIDLIVLDLGLPDQSGLDVCRAIREHTGAPILVLSARHGDAEKVRLLDAGADDYMTKPFSTVEFQARVRAQLRRARVAATEAERADCITAGGLTIDLANRTIHRDTTPIHLTPIEWSLVRVLVANEGRTLTHGQLFAAVWSRSEGDAQQYLRVHIANLRRKLERNAVQPRLIITEPGVGYRFDAGPAGHA